MEAKQRIRDLYNELIQTQIASVDLLSDAIQHAGDALVQALLQRGNLQALLLSGGNGFFSAAESGIFSDPDFNKHQRFPIQHDQVNFTATTAVVF